jgi:hypothetical protein
MSFSLSDGVESELTLELVDVWSTEAGERTTLPAGSTPTSGKDRLVTSLATSRYIPNGETQVVEIGLSIASSFLEVAPLSAGIRLTVRPSSESRESGSVDIVASATAFVFATHPDHQSNQSGFTPEINNSNFSIRSLTQSHSKNAIGGLLLLQDGLVQSSFHTSNLGSLFAFVSHEFSIRRAGFWVDPLAEDSLVFQTSIGQSIITSGQSRIRDISLTSPIAGTGGFASLVSDWGLYELVLKTSHNSGNNESFDSFESVLILIFPFQATLMVLILAIALMLIFQGRPKKDVRQT